MREIIAQVADDNILTEIRKDWATNILTALCTINGNTVGIVANQPQSLAGTLDISASQKGARFVNFCDAFNIPIVTFVDTPDSNQEKDLEWRGMIRHGGPTCLCVCKCNNPANMCDHTKKLRRRLYCDG